MFEDVSEYFVGDYLASGDLGEVVEDEAEVFGQEVATEIEGHAVEDALEIGVGSAEGFVVSGGGDDDVVLGQCGEVSCVDEGVLKGGEAKAGFGTYGYCGLGELGELGGLGELRGIGQVRLIADHDELLALGFLLHLFGFLLGGLLVDDPEHDGCLVELLVGALDAYGFHDVVGVAQAGGVDEAEDDALNLYAVLDDVAGGAVDVADDGALVTDKTVQ